MVKQGCQEIETDNIELILLFWKEYLEEKSVLKYKVPKDQLH